MVERNSHRRALFELNIAGLVFGGTALFSKIIDLPIVDVVGWRVIFAFLALAVFASIRGHRFAILKWQDLGWFALIGGLLALHWVAYFSAMRVSTIAIGISALFTYPVMAVLLEPLFFPKKLAIKDLVVATVVVIGVVVLLPWQPGSENITLGVGLGVLSALLFALRVLVQKKTVQHYPSSVSMIYQLAFGAVVLSIIWGWRLPAATTHWWQLVLLGVCFTALPHTLVVHCLSTLRAKTLGIVSCMQPVYAAIIAMIFIGEMPSYQTIIGASIILSAAIFEMLSQDSAENKT